MVSEEARRKFEDMKVLLVDPDGGAAAFIDEIERGPRCDVEIVLGAGPWEQREEYVAGEGRTEVPATAYAAPRPLLHGAEPGMGRAGATRLAWTLSLGDDPWLAEHRIAGVPVLPSACALEIMARGLAEIWPDWTLNEISAHRLLAGLKLEDDAPGDVELLLTGGEHSDIDGFGARAELRSAGKTPRVLYRSNGVFAAATPEARAAPRMPELPASPVTAAQAYREILSHGPRYQLVTEITGLGPAGMTARVRPSVPDAFGAGTALFDPGLVDVAAQMVWVWTNRTRGAAALPNGIARVARHAGGPATSMQLRILPETDESRIFADVAFLDAAGRAVLDLQQMECTYNPALERICGYDGEVIV